MSTQNSNAPAGPESLKAILFELGNRLVLEEKYTPSLGHNEDAGSHKSDTYPIALFMAWLNQNPNARSILQELGIKWDMP